MRHDRFPVRSYDVRLLAPTTLTESQLARVEAQLDRLDLEKLVASAVAATLAAAGVTSLTVSATPTG